MKNVKLLMIALAAVPAFFFSTSYAASSCDADAVHCTYSTAQAGQLGKFIKITWDEQQLTSPVLCAPLDVSFELDSDDVTKFNLQPNTQQNWHVYQCNNLKCDAPIGVINDSFKLIQENPKLAFSSSPKEVSFALEPNFGENCVAPLSGALRIFSR